MTKTKHIDHAELVQLGKVFLLFTDRLQNTIDFSSLSEVIRKVPIVNDLPTALLIHGGGCVAGSL
jgi:hypothetical protein